MTSFTRRVFVGLSTLALLAFGTAPALAIPLSDLLAPGAFIDSDGLRFSGFVYSGTGDMPAAADVNVTPIMDADGNYGIRFQAPFLDTTASAGTSDAGLSFLVQVIEGALITDAHLAGDPNMIPDPVADGFVTVTETIDGQEQMEIFAFSDPALGSKFMDWVILQPTDQITLVVKDILALANQGVATVSVIDQTFSRGFPPLAEPGTALLLGLGLTGLTAAGRRRGPTGSGRQATASGPSA